MRLAKYISQQGYCSRRQAEELILSCEVIVNGETANITIPIDPDKDVVTIKGEALIPQELVYIMLNKPQGVVCTCKPSREKGKTALDLVKVPQRVFPVGRLDKNSRGLLLLTNDGELAFRLTHPSQGCEKEYLVKLNTPLNPDDEQLLTDGLSLNNTMCRFHRLEKLSNKTYKVVLKQGHKRQIRLMVKALGKSVLDLQRVRIGQLVLGELPEGKWRYLSKTEINSLKTRNEK